MLGDCSQNNLQIGRNFYFVVDNAAFFGRLFI